jgi:hypothetical protein
MVKLVEAAGTQSTARSFAPVALDGSSRLTFKRLRRPTPLPTIASFTGFGRYLDRLHWLFGSR